MARRNGKNRLISSIAALALIISGTFITGISANALDTEKIEIYDAAFVSSFGKLSYAGKSHTAFKSFEEGLAAVKDKEYALVVFNGTNNELVSSTLGAKTELTLEGIGATETGNLITSSNTEFSLTSDVTLRNCAVKFPENNALYINGHQLVLDKFDTHYTIPDYTTGKHSYSPLLNIYGGNAENDFSVFINSGTFGKIALGSGNIKANAYLKAEGADIEKLVVGTDGGSFEGNINVDISSNVGELVIGAENGTMKGDINVNITEGNIEKLSVGAYGENASFTGNVIINVKNATIAEIGGKGNGASEGGVIYILSGTNDFAIADDAKYDTMASVSDGVAVPVFDGTKFVGLKCYDGYGCSAKCLNDGQKDILPDASGVFPVSVKLLRASVVSAIKLAINDSANFVAGYEDGTFAPQKNMTKAEAITLLTRIITDENAVKNGSFELNLGDVDINAWYKNYVAFFDAAGLLTKVKSPEGLLEADKPITRAQFVQLIYNIEKKIDKKQTYADFAKLVYNVSANLDNIKDYNEFSDVTYENTYGNAIYSAVANGYIAGYTDGTFAPDGNITRAEVVTIVNRMLGRRATGKGENTFSDIKSHWAEAQILAAANKMGTAWTRSSDERSASDGTKLPEYVEKLMTEKKQKTIYYSIARNVYVAATDSLIADDITDAEKKVLAEKLEALKKEATEPGKSRDITGTFDDIKSHIFFYFNGPYIREAEIQGNKPGTDPVYIVQITDTHFNLVNDKDEEEKNPSIMSTKEGRVWLRGGASIEPVKRAMEFAKYSDQTVITGDVLDYLSHGCKQLVIENLFRKDTDILACFGGHDTTRVMQGTVPDTSSYESRLDFLRDFWPHDIHYASKVVKDKVMCVVLDNGASKFWEDQIEPLKRDIEIARKNGYVILVFEHEPLCTKNPDETNLYPIRRNDTENYDFCNSCIGSKASGATLEVYNLITQNADVVKGVFCGHFHSDYYTEICGSYTDKNGNKVDAKIPQYILTAAVYDNTGHVINITVK